MTLKAIIIDSREPDWVKGRRFHNVPVTVTELPAGDAWLATEDATIIVERKTFSDLLASIADGRLFDQCARMVEISKWCYLVTAASPPAIEGKHYWVDGKRTEWTVRQVQGTLTTVQQLGVVVLSDIANEEYHDTLHWLAARKRGNVFLTPLRQAIMASPAEQVLMAIPGIGEKHAGQLLKEYETAAWAVMALTDGHAAKVLGIGPAKCAAAKRVYGLDDEQYLAVNLKEKGKENE